MITTQLEAALTAALEPSIIDVLREILPASEAENVFPAVVENKFLILDEQTATWAAGKIAAAQNEIERRRAQVDEYVADAEANLKRLEYLFVAGLRSYAQTVLGDGKKRSLKLPSATLAFRRTNDRLDVTNEQEVIQWAGTLDVPDVVETVYRVKKTGLNKHWETSGEVPPGCVVVPGEDRFSVR